MTHDTAKSALYHMRSRELKRLQHDIEVILHSPVQTSPPHIIAAMHNLKRDIEDILEQRRAFFQATHAPHIGFTLEERAHLRG